VSIRDQILATDDIPKKIVEVPEWGMSIEVRGMTGADRTAILESAVNPTTGAVDLKVMYPDIVIASAHDPETGEKIFSPSDRDVLMAKSATALDRLAEAGMQVGGLSKQESDDAGKRFPDSSDS
jgi:hypothetical protein